MFSWYSYPSGDSSRYLQSLRNTESMLDGDNSGRGLQEFWASDISERVMGKTPERGPFE